MVELVLPSSPVWYQTRGCDISVEGFFAFASRNLIYVFDLRNLQPLHHAILCGHEDRIISCSFSSTKSDDGFVMLASTSDDCTVKMWSINTKSVVKEHKAHGSNKPLTVHWSQAKKDLIVSGDEKGFLVVWNIEKDTTNRYLPDGISQNQLTCVSCSPHHWNLVAVAYKSGAASIFDISGNGHVLRKLRGHGNEIQALVWAPHCMEDVFYGESEQEVGPKTGSKSLPLEGLLATGSKDRTVRVWSLSKGKCLKILKLPSRPSKGKRVNDETTRLYVTIMWPKDSRSMFYSSSFNGDIVCWDVGNSDKGLHKILSSDNPDAGHQRVVFNICQCPTNHIVTTSMDRTIKFWSMETPQSPPVWSLPSLGGFVYAIAASPVDPSLIALGVGDGVIRVWKTKDPRNQFNVLALWQGVKEKVMSLSWHPQREGLLAFGTEDGKVGLYDILTQRPPVISETYHMRAVYSMSWGPHCYGESDEISDVSDTVCLYTCGGEGVILMHKPSELSRDAVNVNNVIQSTNERYKFHQSKHSDVKWRADMTLVAVGNDNGTFNIFSSPHLHIVVTVKVHSKIINCLAWCPNNASESSYLIASGSNSSTVSVNDVSQAVEMEKMRNSADDSKGFTIPVITEPFRSLSGHTARITNISWNAKDPNELASASYDGTVEVWDVANERPLANYRGHDGRILCVHWSSVVEEGEQSGLLYSGADDYSVHVWKQEKLQHNAPPTELQTVGFTQKQSSQWKRKNKKRKSASSKTDVTSEPHQRLKSPAPTNNTNRGTGKEFYQPNDSELDLLLEKKKAELLAEIDIDNGVDETLPPLNPDARPFDPIPSEAPKISPTLRDALDELSKARSAGERHVIADDETSHVTRRRRVKNLFPVSVSMDNRNKEHQQSDCVDIVKLRTNKISSSVVDERTNLGLYGNRVTAFRMFHQEEQKLSEMENLDGSYTIKSWRGDIVGAIEEAIEREDLTDQLVALAPLAGYDVWQHAAQAFADQLVKSGMHMHASQYLVACNKVREAVTLLRDNKHYREAVGLARARLLDDDPLLIETVRLWANKLKIGGSHDMAAKCFASIGDYIRSAECISHRATVKSVMGKDELQALFAAYALLKTADKPVEAREYGRRALSSVCLRTGMWQQGDAAAQAFEKEAAVYRAAMHIHEILVTNFLFKTSSDDDMSLVNLFSHPSPLLEKEPDVQHRQLTDILKTQIKVNLHDMPGTYVEALEISKSNAAMTSSNPTVKQVLYQMSLYFTAAFFGFNQGSKTQHNDAKEDYVTDWVQHVLLAENLCANSNIPKDSKQFLSDVVWEIMPEAKTFLPAKRDHVTDGVCQVPDIS